MASHVPPRRVRLVECPPCRLADYRDLIGAEAHDRIRARAAALDGTRVLHVNSTAYGGGVAEILQSLIPLLQDAAVGVQWGVLDAPATFFDVTKKVHNALQGMPVDLTDDEKALFLDTTRENAASLPEADAVVAHDPQTVALARYVARLRRAAWVWRCHIDLTTAHEPAWAFVRPFVEAHRVAIFTMPQFVRPDLAGPRVLTIAPAIDPLSEKNGPMTTAEARAVVARFGIDPERPLLLQVSRFDPWKDQLGVIDAYRLVKGEIPEVQLALVGSLADDDPESVAYLGRAREHADGDRDVFLLTDANGVRHREVNAFQRAAAVVVQKSLREGFGLVVSEALWKGVPVVAGKVGGIPLQIEDGTEGHLVTSVEECARRCVELLRDPERRRRMGEAGQRRVRERFLITRYLVDHLELIASLRG